MNLDNKPWAPHKIVLADSQSVFPTQFYRENERIIRQAMTHVRADLLFREVVAAEIVNAAIAKMLYPAPYVPNVDEVEDR